MTVPMHDAGLNSCCGARFLAQFGNCADYEDTIFGEKWNGKKGNEALKKELKHKINIWRGQAFLVAILNSEQWGNVGKIFTDVGFKVVACGHSSDLNGPKLRLLAFINYEEDVEKDNAKKKVVRNSKRKTGVALF